MIVKNSEGNKFQLAEGVNANVLGRGGKLMVVENTFNKGAKAALHTHEHEQVTYIVKGSFEFTISGEKYILNVGDSFFVQSNEPHGCTALEDGVLIDIFTPQREDILEKIK